MKKQKLEKKTPSPRKRKTEEQESPVATSHNEKPTKKSQQTKIPKMAKKTPQRRSHRLKGKPKKMNKYSKPRINIQIESSKSIHTKPSEEERIIFNLPPIPPKESPQFYCLVEQQDNPMMGVHE